MCGTINSSNISSSYIPFGSAQACLEQLDNLIVQAFTVWLTTQSEDLNPYKPNLKTLVSQIHEKVPIYKAEILDLLLPTIGITDELKELLDEIEVLQIARRSDEYRELSSSEKRKLNMELARYQRAFQNKLPSLTKCLIEHIFGNYDSMLQYIIGRISIMLADHIHRLLDRLNAGKLLEEDK